jgi:CheY-like chemotaxis protein
MKTILVVDDDDLLVQSLTDLLELEGYRVMSAENGKDGLARLEKEKPDMVLTNLMLPIAGGLYLVDGVDVVSKLRSIPVVLMSTSHHQGVPLSPRSVGVSAFLGKPFGLDELLPIIERLIGKGEPETVVGQDSVGRAAPLRLQRRATSEWVHHRRRRSGNSVISRWIEF